MEYKAAIDYLFNQFPSFKKYGANAVKYGLHNIETLCDALDNPQKKFKSIHVAGTNGKGSVTHILSAIFMAAGYKTGTFTSPHYVDFRERIKIDGKYISKNEVVEFIKNNKILFEQINASFFEITAAMAFWHFQQQQVDIAIIETGLGGRLDSTNIITPQLSVITNIGLDHQNMLGNTLVEIAGEKAGIIKPNVPVVIGEEQKEVKQVFIDKCKTENILLFYANEMLSIEKVDNECEFEKLTYKASYQKRKKQIEFETDLIASYQIKNLTTAIAATEVYNNFRHNYLIRKNALVKALRNIKTTTKMLGKWMVLQNKPTVIADSAHNLPGINAILNTLNKYNFNQLHIVLGMMKDKEVNEVLKLLPKSATYYFCSPNFLRAMDSTVLKEEAATFNLNGDAYTNVNEATEAAIKKATADDLVLITGSCFVVAAVI